MTLYRTSVEVLRATPLGLLPECWHVEHHCCECRQRVEPDRLIAHTREHQQAQPEPAR